MEIFITGDTHGDFCRFRPDIFYEQEHMSKEDLVLVCGDFGGIWYGDPRDDAGLDWLDSLPYTTAFVLGNHENYDAYKGYPKEEWHGGQIQRIRPSVLHLMRGQVYELNGRKFFTMGGASSHDIQDGILEPDDPDFEEKFQQLEQRGALFRVNHRSWWAEELPSEAEYLEAREQEVVNIMMTLFDEEYILKTYVEQEKREAAEQATEKATKEAARKLYQKGTSVADIADVLSVTEQEVKQWLDIVP